MGPPGLVCLLAQMVNSRHPQAKQARPGQRPPPAALSTHRCTPRSVSHPSIVLCLKTVSITLKRMLFRQKLSFQLGAYREAREPLKHCMQLPHLEHCRRPLLCLLTACVLPVLVHTLPPSGVQRLSMGRLPVWAAANSSSLRLPMGPNGAQGNVDHSSTDPSTADPPSALLQLSGLQSSGSALFGE